MATAVSRLDFGDGVIRKLKCRHRYMRDAVKASGRSVFELAGDPFGGYPYLLQALLQPGSTTPISLDKASELIDTYLDHHEGLSGLTKAISDALSGYLSIEITPVDDEADDAGTLPNAATPVAPGRSAD
jgi:hypothetical protein